MLCFSIFLLFREPSHHFVPPSFILSQSVLTINFTPYANSANNQLPSPVTTNKQLVNTACCSSFDDHPATELREIIAHGSFCLSPTTMSFPLEQLDVLVNDHHRRLFVYPTHCDELYDVRGEYGS
ncbi:hypothetical protein BD626DRAFT_577873 [Schizophyllum amplum]|uniref:Uncharacterized protein n=1 Tax=Schizophyllum amplum TaxID=97359 RepID=A0A550BSB6_9AGAR|nr:hypothetical protein BD626DRAFT_577873 [Auriculariopsis ampla]